MKRALLYLAVLALSICTIAIQQDREPHVHVFTAITEGWYCAGCTSQKDALKPGDLYFGRRALQDGSLIGAIRTFKPTPPPTQEGDDVEY